MKKKVIVFFCIIAGLVIAAGLSLLFIYHSGWAKQKNEKSLSTAAVSDELTSREGEFYARDTFWVLYVDAEDFVDVEFRLTELSGTVEITIYGAEEARNADFDYESIMNPDYMLMRRELNETGNYRYSLTEFAASCYVIYVTLTPGSEFARLDSRMYRWNNNWNYWMYRFGIKKAQETDVDAIKTGLVGK